MKTALHILVFIFLLPLAAYSQKKTEPRKLLHAKVIADSIAVDNLTVKNITSNISAVTDTDGLFTLYARPTDTLYFSGISFRSAYLVVSEPHFLEDRLLIRLNVNVTVLDEVVITPNVLSGDLIADSRKTKTKAIASTMTNVGEEKVYNVQRNKYDMNQNGALPTQITGSQLTGVNFVRIYETFFKKKRSDKKQDRGEIYSLTTSKSFTEVVKERFTYHFFTQTLKIPKDEIGLFLVYCDKGAETNALLDPKRDFELTDYLVAKGSEYLAQKK
ncbi:hypothetical protein GR160_08370 [Flavobacterium sp. Sd200]|uniref:hypothetical protein n=1 Tax=Flavobacterium sp. Sd200 TaxID=2692211 RepID=UPI001370FB6C|nr:hypothetical protein [Flavobacterium sp. Sd200]MXN91242.1 hypothetical protein [Flavobacterium sp. Sd200]